MNRNQNSNISTLADRLKLAIDAAGMRPIDLSNKTDIPKSMISYYLTGRSKPKADRLYKIAHLLNVSEAWLLGYDVPMTRAPEQAVTDRVGNQEISSSAEQINEDALTAVVARLRTDPDFLDVVTDLASLDGTAFSMVKHYITVKFKRTRRGQDVHTAKAGRGGDTYLSAKK